MFETLGHYNVLDRIGAGGMGEVYRARDTRLGRTVAIKVLPQDVAADPDRRARFLQEARATAALSHPNIAALYEIGKDQDQLFLVFEFVPGETLKNTIAGRPMNPRRAIDLAVQIADALADAHAEGIVHRDIKPDNILVTPKGNAKILDFGLATWTASGAERDHAATRMDTAAGTTLGTVAYMSPEQALGERVDHRTDIFSLGIVIFEMLTGKLPFSGPTPTALALQIVQAPAPLPSSINRSLPVEFDAIVGKAMAKSLEQRYDAAVTLAAELRSIGAILEVRSDMQEAAAVLVPAQPARGSFSGWIILLLVLAAVGAAGWYERVAIRQFWRHSIGPAPAPMIAVIPFETDSSQTFFADGLAEDLTTRLGQTPGLRVIGRSASRQYRGREPRDVARELGAAVVLTGSVRPSGDTVKVSLELIDPSDNTALWSAQYTRDVKDIFAVQAQVAEEVTRALRLKLQPTPSSARAASRLVDPRAYELYLRGRQAMADRHMADAIPLFERAIAADAGLGEAFAGIAYALHLQVAFDGAADTAEIRARLQSAAKRAYELDPDLPQANVAMALASDALDDSLKYLRRAVELDPSYAEAYHAIADEVIGFVPDLAVGFFRKSLALDARQEVVRLDLAEALMRLGHDEEAAAEMKAITERTEFPGYIAEDKAINDVTHGRYAAAAATLTTVSSSSPPLSRGALLVGVLRQADRSDEALAEASALTARFPQACEAKALLAALRFERRDVASARQLANAALAEASANPPASSAMRCGLHAAAALQSGGQAAALLDRLSVNERLLRGFAEYVQGQSGEAWIDPHMYPWSLIARDPIVVEARQRLEAAYQKQREIARDVLKGLP